VYNFNRLRQYSLLDSLEIQITKGDRAIKSILNVFKLEPECTSLDSLSGYEDIPFRIPPNAISEMQLRWDGLKYPPIVYILTFATNYHILEKALFASGREKKIIKLEKIIKKDLSNINFFVSRWHEIMCLILPIGMVMLLNKIR